MFATITGSDAILTIEIFTATNTSENSASRSSAC